MTTNEGGGFLAYAKADNDTDIDVGAVNSARTADNVTNGWKPTQAGVYIFRRSIGGTSAAPTYTYAGYYFDGVADYYKIVIGDDNYRAESTTAGEPNGVVFDLATPESAITGITIDRANGSFTGNPKIWYVKDTKVSASNVTFKLDGTNKRLIVEYAATAPVATETDGTNTVTYDAVADAARKEVDYINKLGISNTDTILYNQAKADYDYKAALVTATNNLYTAAKNRNTQSGEYTGATSGLETAWNNLKSTVESTRTTWLADVNGFRTGLTVNVLVPDAVQSAITSNASLTQCKANLADMKTLETEITHLVEEINDEYDKIRTVDAIAGKTAEEVEAIVSTCKIKLTSLQGKLEAYSNAYAGLTSNNTVTSLLESQGITDIASKKNAINDLKAKIGSTYMISLDTDVAAYRSAWDTNETEKSEDTAADAAWREAIIAYNTAVSAAKDAYDAAIAKAVPTPQDPNRTTYDVYINNGADIVSANAAESGTTGDNPTIDVDTAMGQYDTYAGYTDRTDPVATDYTGLETTMNTSVGNTNTAKDAYDNATLALDSSSKITIYVNLAADYADNWTLDDKALESDPTKATFYLNKILDAGATSDKLIDSVTFADTVTARDYKNLTFDLNVALDSAQITYGDDQKTIQTDAVTATGSAFKMKPVLQKPTDINTVIRWDMIPATTPTNP